MNKPVLNDYSIAWIYISLWIVQNCFYLSWFDLTQNKLKFSHSKKTWAKFENGSWAQFIIEESMKNRYNHAWQLRSNLQHRKKNAVKRSPSWCQLETNHTTCNRLNLETGRHRLEFITLTHRHTCTHTHTHVHTHSHTHTHRYARL